MPGLRKRAWLFPTILAGSLTGFQSGGHAQAPAISPAGSGVIGTVVFPGDYIGDNRLLEIDALLRGDASLADRLLVQGATSGSTEVIVVDIGGGGGRTREGIKIVEVDGASDGSFTLRGDYRVRGQEAIAAGAYSYVLQQGGFSMPDDGDWYLRSRLPGTGTLYQAGAPLYETYANALLAFNQPGTLMQRLGNRSWSALPGAHLEGTGLWGKIAALGGNIEPSHSTSSAEYDLSSWKVQAGVDVLLQEADKGSFVGGLMMHYGQMSSDVDSPHGSGTIESSSWGVGATLTWYGTAGVYLDAQAQLAWLESDLYSDTARRDLAEGNDGLGYSLSLEVGQKTPLGANWSLSKQAQLAFAKVKFDAFTDPFDAHVSLEGSDSLVGRVGLALARETQWKDKAGRTIRSNLYGLANVYYDFADGSQTQVANVTFTSENDSVSAGIGAGGSLNFANDMMSFYGEAEAKIGLENTADSYEVSGTVGFRIRW